MPCRCDDAGTSAEGPSAHVMSTAESSVPQEASQLEPGLRNPAAARLIIFSRWSGYATEIELRKSH